MAPGEGRGGEATPRVGRSVPWVAAQLGAQPTAELSGGGRVQ